MKHLLLVLVLLSLTAGSTMAQEVTPTGNGNKSTNNVSVSNQDPLAAQQSGECVAIPKDVDATIPDGSSLQTGTQQTKTWRLLNCGTTTWKEYHVRYLTSNGTEDAWLMANPGLETKANKAGVPLTKPGETAEVSITFTVPQAGTRYVITFMMENAGGLSFRKIFWVDFKSVA